MTIFSGKKVGIGVWLEATRGQKATIAYWMPWTDNTFTDKANVESEAGVVDTLMDSIGSEVTKQRAEGTIGGQVYPNGIGFFLKALLGAVATVAKAPAHEHTFTLLESNTHPTLTIGTSSPLGSSSYPLAMIESMDFNAEVGGKLTVSVKMRSKKGESVSHTVQYQDEKGFVANMLKVYLADNVAGLNSAQNICLQSITLSISKEIKDIECLSSVDPIDYINAGVKIEWSMEMIFENNTYKDLFLNGTPKAFRMLAEDTKHPINGTHKNTLQVDLSKVQFTDWTPAYTIDDITKQSVKFKGHYDVKTRKAIEIKLKNTQASY